MQLRFRVRSRTDEGEPGGDVSRSLVLVPCMPRDVQDPNHLAWRGGRPVGQVTLNFLDPRITEQFSANVEVTVAIRVRESDEHKS